MTYPNGTDKRRKPLTNNRLHRFLEFLSSSGVPRLKCPVTDLEPVPAHPCLKLATSYPQVTSQPLAATSAPYPLKSLTVSSPYPHRRTSNRLLEVLRCGYGEDTVTLGRGQAQDRERRGWTRLPQRVGAQTSNPRRICGFHSAGAGNGAAARTPHSGGCRCQGDQQSRLMRRQGGADFVNGPGNPKAEASPNTEIRKRHNRTTPLIGVAAPASGFGIRVSFGLRPSGVRI